MTEQMNLFGKVCECGQTATIVQQTLYGDELYCMECYDNMVKEKEQGELK